MHVARFIAAGPPLLKLEHLLKKVAEPRKYDSMFAQSVFPNQDFRSIHAQKANNPGPTVSNSLWFKAHGRVYYRSGWVRSHRDLVLRFILVRPITIPEQEMVPMGTRKKGAVFSLFSTCIIGAYLALLSSSFARES